jgi:hypothetical protein
MSPRFSHLGSGIFAADFGSGASGMIVPAVMYAVALLTAARPAVSRVPRR